MLKPRETDLLSLFIFFVMLPLVTYFLLGKWKDSAKRKERINLIAQQVSQESDQIDDMAVNWESTVMPLVHLPNYGNVHLCAKCFGPAKTRCSRCKSARYCSGRCQIAHWRQVHKFECHILGDNDYQGTSSTKPVAIDGSYGNVSYAEKGKYLSRRSVRVDEASSDRLFSPPQTPLSLNAAASDLTVITCENSMPDKKSMVHENEPITGDGAAFLPSDHPTLPQSQKNSDVRCSEFLVSENLDVAPTENVADVPSLLSEKDNRVDDKKAVSGINAHSNQTVSTESEILTRKGVSCDNEIEISNLSSGSISMNKIEKSRDNSNGKGPHNSPKQGVKVSVEPPASHLHSNCKDHVADESRYASSSIVRTMDMKKLAKVDQTEQHSENVLSRQRKLKMIFPYEEFVKCFHMELSNMSLSPRGLVNCGNSCYANAVLQCLTCTKPFTVYLLHRLHSRAGCSKNWCLMCELEQLAMLLRKRGGPLSPVNILTYVRRLNSQLGDESQEDAHEFLRLLVASMQTISLEAFSGEKAVDSKLQDTTFIQHMFGGRLKSKVKCLNCNHESSRCEEIMDLTLEILDQVESLQDALAQFTRAEFLDGENMYRCLRCAAYVRAQKQLKIQDAPNILTIVLKRFKEGSYGKINKYINFPEWLDMAPYMTGTEGTPPLYMLYGVVVHLDTSNASFSGHYISYVKDMQGNWFKVDDAEVKAVKLSHVLSQGAYILFYMRSHPRVLMSSKSSRNQTVSDSSRSQHANPNSSFIEKQSYINQTRLDTNINYNTNISREVLIRENRSSTPPTLKSYADHMSSDWSLFTSSDDSSFSTDSARDSFGTTEITEVPFSSVYHSLYPIEQSNKSRRTIACSMFPRSRMLTCFAREETGVVFSAESSVSGNGGAGYNSCGAGHVRTGV